jgi:transcriptional regulator with XRE-family HTH domain
MRPRDVLASNLRKLMAAVPSLSRIPDLVEATGGELSNGTIDRVRRASISTGVDVLEAIAEAFGIEPWQLLVPTLEAMPTKDTDREIVHLAGMPSWPFPRIDQARFMALDPEQRAFVEGMIASEITALEAPTTEDVQRFEAGLQDRRVNPPQRRRKA